MLCECLVLPGIVLDSWGYRPVLFVSTDLSVGRVEFCCFAFHENSGWVSQKCLLLRPEVG